VEYFSEPFVRRGTVRKPLGYIFFIVGALLLSFSFGRYVSGALDADRARAAWESAEAKSTLALARSAMRRAGAREVIAAGAPVARLVIPRLALDEIVLEGVGDDELNAEPGHMPGTALPGEVGNSVVSAHRDRHFNHLDAISVGDTITTESGALKQTWVVVGKRIVGKNEPALFPAKDPTLTLTTCWPIRYIGPAPERLIVTAKPLAAPAKRLGQVASTN
jgi:sortase A